jgi:hypothetical protein
MNVAVQAVLGSVRPGVTPWPLGTCNCAKALAVLPRMLMEAADGMKDSLRGGFKLAQGL